MMSMSAMLMVLLLGGGGQTGDLLDFTPTNNYWEMRDQRIVDMETMAAVLADDEATATDKLMAIRSIGEWVLTQEADPDIQADPADKAEALKALAPFVGSKEPFVDRYAKRSIAWIKGEEPEPYPALPDTVYDRDLALLPDDMTLVGQLKMKNGAGPVDLAMLIPDAKVDGRSMRDMMMQELLPGLLRSVELIGNARVDLVTLGMRLNSQEDFLIALVVRGRYDRVGVQVALEDEVGEDDNTSFYSVGDIEVVAVNNHDPFAMLMPSDELFILLFAEQREVKLPVDAVAARLQQPDRGPSFDDVLAEQVDAIDRDKADVWAALKVTALMNEERELRQVFGAFDAARAFAVADSKGVMDVQWVAQGANADQVGQAAAFLDEKVKEGIEEISREKTHMPAPMQAMMDPMLEMMRSMKFKADGKTMTGGMKVDPKVGMTMPMMMIGMQPRHRHEARLEAAEVLEAAEAAGPAR